MTKTAQLLKVSLPGCANVGKDTMEMASSIIDEFIQALDEEITEAMG